MVKIDGQIFVARSWERNFIHVHLELILVHNIK